MGCSSSTQTQLQESDRPSSKLGERNGASKCGLVIHGEKPVAPGINGPIIDESETIPDHSQLLDTKELDTAPDEVVTSEPGPSETVGVLEAAAEAGLSSVAAELVIDEPEAEISEASMEATSPSDADAQPLEAEEQTEGETGERLESEINVDTGMEELETKEEATEVAEAPEVTEMKSKED